jgi:hypothetical protein
VPKHPAFCRSCTTTSTAGPSATVLQARISIPL